MQCNNLLHGWSYVKDHGPWELSYRPLHYPKNEFPTHTPTVCRLPSHPPEKHTGSHEKNTHSKDLRYDTCHSSNTFHLRPASISPHFPHRRKLLHCIYNFIITISNIIVKRQAEILIRIFCVCNMIFDKQ